MTIRSKYSFISLRALDKIFRLLEKDNNFSCLLDISEGCDLKCLFCSRSLEDKKKRSSELKLDTVIIALKSIYPLLKRKELCISGTEPLAYSNIVDIVRCAKRIGFSYINIRTSGVRLVDKQLVKALFESGVNRFDLPIYGHNFALHDSIVGKTGSFEKLIKAVENLKKYSEIEIVLHTVPLKQNYRVLHQLDEFVHNTLKIPAFLKLSNLFKHNCKS